MSESELRYLYSMVITRLVNGFLDQLQNNMSYTTMSVLAQQKLVGFPILLVDIRIQAVHGVLPSLDLLQSAADMVCFVWL